jgi:stress response protein SCP2
MKQVVAGERVLLNLLSKNKRFQVHVEVQGACGVDLSCFGLDAQGRLGDERYFVFYNQPSSPEGEIRLKRREDGGEQGFEVNLAAMPPQVQRLSFVLTLHGAQGAQELGVARVSLWDDVSEVWRFEFGCEGFGPKKGLGLAEVYYREGWRIVAVGDSAAGDLEEVLRGYGGEAAMTHEGGQGEAREDDAPMRAEAQPSEPAPAVGIPRLPPLWEPEGPALGASPPAWLERLAEDGGVRQFFERLDHHGVITEEEAVAIFGGPRRLRRFSLGYDEIVKKVPFRVKIDNVSGVKRYTKEK